MAHYAFLDEENIVIEVIVGKNENEGDTNWETYYENVRGKTCKRTSYNTFHNSHKEGGTPFRGNYAGINFTYDETNDVFIPPKPYESWTLNSSIWDWEAPVEKPTDGLYEWNESTTQWDKID
jgi:hypothetical protein|tara:strand:+ start:1354 stop:1719 length:366 start_codon:yes stop_codon:yes gene_type:complete